MFKQVIKDIQDSINYNKTFPLLFQFKILKLKKIKKNNITLNGEAKRCIQNICVRKKSKFFSFSRI